MNPWVQAVIWWLKTSTFSVGSPADRWNTFCGFFHQKFILSIYFGGGSLAKNQVVTFFPCVSCAILHFLAILVTSSDTESSMPGKRGGKLLLREEASRYISGLSQRCSNPVSTNFWGKRGSGCKNIQVRGRSDPSDVTACLLGLQSFPEGPLCWWFFLLAQVARNSAAQRCSRGGLLYVSTLGDTLTSFWHLPSEIALALSLLQLKVDSQPMGQLLALPWAVLSCPVLHQSSEGGTCSTGCRAS